MEYNNLEYGQIGVLENQLKPIICRKTYKNILREGAVYYRYRGETKEINYPELNTILENERKKERLLWLQHIEKISAIGPKNIHFLDTYRGEIHIGNEKVLIDPSLLDKIKFIKEGQFVEKDGAPTLTLAGEITGILDTHKTVSTDKAYPYFSSDFCKAFNLNQHQVKCLFWKLRVKDNPKYHEAISTGANTFTHKYPESLKSRVKAIIKRYPNYVDEACREFSGNQAAKKKQMS